MQERLPALLVAGSLNIARVTASKLGWQTIAMDRYLTPEGEEVQAIADRSGGLYGRPAGTRIYLAPRWSYRDDLSAITDMMADGRLVGAKLPAPLP